jgi:hypothetical protein
VAGAAVGNGLADGLGVGDGEWLRVADALAEGLALVLADVGLVVGVAVGVGVALGEIVDVAEAVPDEESPGANEVGVAEGEEPEQAETNTEASAVTVTQQITLNPALSPVPAMVVRIFYGTPSCVQPVPAPFPVPAFTNPSRKGNPVAGPCARPARQVPESVVGHKGKAWGQHRHAMARSSLGH